MGTMPVLTVYVLPPSVSSQLSSSAHASEVPWPAPGKMLGPGPGWGAGVQTGEQVTVHQPGDINAR